jgi:hypothetical protein
MKWISVPAFALLSVSLAQSGVPQSTHSAVTTKDQVKQDRQASKAKAKATKNDSKAESGKKTTTSQDAAYALVYRTESRKSSPK